MAIIKSHIKLCTFDVTNTLLKFRLSVGEQYSKIGHIYGVSRDPVQLNSAFMHHWKLMNVKYPNFGHNDGFSSKSWWKQIVQQTFSVGGNNLSEKQLTSISNHLYDLYENDICWEVAPGSRLLLQNLKQKGLTMGVISNFDERLDSVLSSVGLKSYFDFILASYIIQIAKPSEKVFDFALRQVPGVTCENAIHIGDNVQLDYLAAKKAGWNALLVTDKLNLDLPKDVNKSDIIHNISDVEKYIFPQ